MLHAHKHVEPGSALMVAESGEMLGTAVGFGGISQFSFTGVSHVSEVWGFIRVVFSSGFCHSMNIF